MKIKIDALGFTQQSMRNTTEKLHMAGIILAAAGTLTSAVSYILNQRSSEWFNASTVEQENWMRELRSDMDQNAD